MRTSNLPGLTSFKLSLYFWAGSFKEGLRLTFFYGLKGNLDFNFSFRRAHIRAKVFLGLLNMSKKKGLKIPMKNHFAEL